MRSGWSFVCLGVLLLAACGDGGRQARVRAANLEQENGRLKRENEELRSFRNLQTSELQKLTGVLKDAIVNLDQLSRDEHAVISGLHGREINVTELKETTDRVASMIADSRRHQQQLQDQLQKVAAKSAGLSAEVARLGQLLGDLRSALERKEQAIAQLSAKLDAVASDRDRLQEFSAELEASVQALNSELRQKQNEIDAIAPRASGYLLVATDPVLEGLRKNGILIKKGGFLSKEVWAPTEQFLELGRVNGSYGPFQPVDITASEVDLNLFKPQVGVSAEFSAGRVAAHDWSEESQRGGSRFRWVKMVSMHRQLKCFTTRKGADGWHLEIENPGAFWRDRFVIVEVEP